MSHIVDGGGLCVIKLLTATYQINKYRRDILIWFYHVRVMVFWETAVAKDNGQYVSAVIMQYTWNIWKRRDML